MNPSAKAELLRRFSSAPHVPGLKSVVETLDALSAMIDSATRKTANDPHLSDQGRRAYVAKIAVDNIKPVVEAAKSARQAMRWNATRKEALKPPTPPRDDIVGEMKRQEIRAFVRGLTMAEKYAVASQHPEAILDAPAVLSGLPDDRYGEIRDAFIKAKFGPELAEIETLDLDLELVGAAYDLAVNELRDNAGLSEAAFAKLVDKHVHETDGINR